MKNLKKVVAVLTAATLCLGMSMTAFAAELDSETPGEVQDPDQKPEETTKQDPTTIVTFDENKIVLKDADGKEVKSIITEMKEETKAALCEPETMKGILENNGLVLKDDQEVTIVSAGDITMDKTATSEGKMDIVFGITSEDDKELKAGDTVYILHEVKDGEWEVYGPIEVVADENGNLTATATDVESFSPFAIIKVTSDGKTQVLDEKGNQIGEIEPKPEDKNDDTTDTDKKDNTTSADKNDDTSVTDKKDATSDKAEAPAAARVTRTTTRTLSPKTGDR